MAGHSKWKNIARRKGKVDSDRAKVFTKLSREIIVAVQAGGPDPAGNSRLKDVIAKARASNVPSDNIKRVIDKAAGAGNTDAYDSIQYEGYGPCGAAVIVETMTDNRNRTAGEMRHYFDKFGGNLGATGCVSWNFDKKGVIYIDKDAGDEDELMLAAIEAGAGDFNVLEEGYEILTEPEDFSSVSEALGSYEMLSAQIELVPRSYAEIPNEDDALKMRKLLDALEDNDDVQNVWHNWEE